MGYVADAHWQRLIDRSATQLQETGHTIVESYPLSVVNAIVSAIGLTPDQVAFVTPFGTTMAELFVQHNSPETHPRSG